MRRSNRAGTVTSECFTWRRQDRNKDKLIYYNAEGIAFERLINSAELDTVLNIFKSQRAAIRRSSGGLVSAKPVQIVVTGDKARKHPLSVRVRFQELTHDPSAGVSSRTCSKTVSVAELFEPFPWEHRGSKAQTFALDFGNGIVPVYPFYYSQSNDMTECYFIGPKDWERLTQAKIGQQIKIQACRIDRAALRWTGSSSHDATGRLAQADRELAQRNLEILSRAKLAEVPKQLHFSEPIEVRVVPSPEDIKHFLSVTIQKVLSGGVTYIDVGPEPDTELLPFGLFEE